MNLYRYFLVSIFLLLPTLLFGQQYNIQIYSVNKGLPQSQVHDITQTQDGYIWMATYGGGLARFDGSSFVNYDTDDGLKNNLVEELYVDSKDELWVTTNQGGVAQFQGDSLIYPVRSDSLNSYSVGTITEADDGSMWFGTYQGGYFCAQRPGNSSIYESRWLIKQYNLGAFPEKKWNYGCSNGQWYIYL